MSNNNLPPKGRDVEMKNPEDWERRGSAPDVKAVTDMGMTEGRKWGATMVPQKRIEKKVDYEVEIYKAYGGDVLENDSADLEQNPVPGGEETAAAAEPFNPNADTKKPETVMARATIAGVNTWWKTYFFLVKGFLGSGMLTLPMGFCNGGALFSILCMAVVCGVSILGMMTLLEVRNIEGGSFSDVAGRALGKNGKMIVDISLACCQVIYQIHVIVIIITIGWALHSLYNLHLSELFGHSKNLGCFAQSRSSRYFSTQFLRY